MIWPTQLIMWVTWMSFGARRDGLLVGAHDLVVVFNGEVKADLLVDDAFAHGALPVRLDHVGVILFGADYLVAGLEVRP